MKRRDQGDRVPKWNSDRPREAYELCLLGATDKNIANVMGVSDGTIELWKRTKPEFLEGLNRGKTIADARVARALYERAIGYSHPDVHIAMYKGQIIKTDITKHYPPDSWAANKWLSIRQRELWADVQRVENTQTNININKFDFSGISTEELLVLKKIGMKQLSENVRDN